MIIDSEHPDRQPIAVPSRIGQGTVQIMLGRMVLFASGYFVAMLLARRLGPRRIRAVRNYSVGCALD